MKQTPFLEVIGTKDFLKIWGSQVFSQVTINVVNFMIILRIFEATRSTVAISLVWVFYAIPAILLGPFSGTIIDLFPKRRVLMVTTIAEAVIILCYLLVKQQIWPIYSVIFMYSLVNQLYIPAEASTLPWTVEKRLLPAANSLFLFTLYGSFLLGFGLAGPLVKFVGQELPFIIASFFLFSASLLVSRLPDERKEKKLKDIQAIWDQAKEGYSFIREHKTVLFPLLLLVFAQVGISILVILAPSFVTGFLGVDLRDAGPLFVFPLGFGAILWVYGVNRLLLKGVRKKKLISFGLGLAGILLLVLALFLPLLGAFRALAAASVSFMLGVSVVSLLIPVQTLIQESTPEEFRGRVFGVLGFAITLASILPVLLTATIADIIGVNYVLAIIAFLTLFVAFYSAKGIR